MKLILLLLIFISFKELRSDEVFDKKIEKFQKDDLEKSKLIQEAEKYTPSDNSLFSDLEKLKILSNEVYSFKFNLDYIHTLASENRWIAILERTKRLASTCSQDTVPSLECNNQMELLHKYVLNSNLEEKNRELLSTFLTNEKQLYENFLTNQKHAKERGNQLIQTIAKKLLVHKSKKQTEKKTNQKINKESKIFSMSYFDIIISIILTSWFVTGTMLLTLIMLIYLLARKIIIKKFYSEIFKLFRKNKTGTRIYGKIYLSQWLKIVKTRTIILRFLNTAQGQFSFSSVRFKTIKNRLIIELGFLNANNFIGVLKNEKPDDFSNAILSLKNWLASNNGNLTLICKYIGDGEIASSKIIIKL
ncbi:MAG: hypothetical protein HOP07_04415 [Bacteriovoracaceae bacterium]|nr:hypothetical protein [Bacteriovoracaceae bacterium]